MRGLRQRTERHSEINPWQRWALNFGAVLGSLCLLAAVLTLVFGLKPLIFASGSMGPNIPTGALGLAVPVPVAEVAPGQVVSVVTSGGTRVTHRVVENRPEGLVLKGDANAVADLQPYLVATADRLLYSVPVLGFVVGWFSQPWAFFVGGLLSAYLLFLAFIRREAGTPPVGGSPCGAVDAPADLAGSARHSDEAEPGTRRRAMRRTGTVLTLLALVAGLGINARIEPTQAAFNANVKAQVNLAALVPGAPANMTCDNALPDVTTIRFTWTSPIPQPTGYRVSAVETQSTGAPLPGAVPKVQTLVGSQTSYETSNVGASDGVLGEALDNLFGYAKYFAIEVTAEYGNWKTTPVSFTKIKATAPTPLLIGEYRVNCQHYPAS